MRAAIYTHEEAPVSVDANDPVPMMYTTAGVLGVYEFLRGFTRLLVG